MNHKKLKTLLRQVQQGECSIDRAMTAISGHSTETVKNACVDHQRLLRTGIPEVIYGESKTAKQIISIARNMKVNNTRVLATRVHKKKATKVQQKLPWLNYHRKARMLTGNIPLEKVNSKGTTAIFSAGTSDLPVAEEAAVTLESLGYQVTRVYDVGVAGLHRIHQHHKILQEATTIIAVAGMEGALPSVVGGLVSCPVIAVPTSVGYGANFGGISALLGMLNSCAPGVAVVNIDNGFGAACMAVTINQQ